MIPGSDGWTAHSSGEIVGVVKDFHYASLHERVNPLVMHAIPQAFDKAMIHIEPGQVKEAREHLERQYASLQLDRPFSFYFLDSFLDTLYKQEKQMARLFSYFAFIILGIACMGLYGLASVSAEQRKREIGIRKVLGANLSGLTVLFAREYVVLVLIATVLATPLAVYSMSGWLAQFAYHVDLTPSIFITAAFLTLGVAVLAVSYHSIRTALADPVRVIRSD